MIITNFHIYVLQSRSAERRRNTQLHVTARARGTRTLYIHLQLVAWPAFDTQLWDAMPGEASKQASSACSRVQRMCSTYTCVHTWTARTCESSGYLINMSPSSMHRRQNPVRMDASAFMMMLILAWRLASSGRARRFCFRII